MVNRTIQMKRHKKSKTVTAKSVQKKWQRNIFLIDSGSTEQQVLHIRDLKFHQKTAVLQNDQNKHFGTSVAPTNNKPAVVQHVGKNTKPSKIHQQNMRTPPPRLTREIRVEPDIKLLWVNSVETNSYRAHRSTCSERKGGRGNLWKGKQNVKKTKARFRREREQQLVTCIQLATELEEIKRRIQNQIKGMFTASSQRIQSSLAGEEARSWVFQSNSRKKYKQWNMRRTGADVRTHLLFRSVRYINIQHWCTVCTSI